MLKPGPGLFCVSELRRKWIQACRRKDAFDPTKTAICERHFRPSDYERDLRNELLNLPLRKMLKPGSIPTQNLLPDMMELHSVSTVGNRYWETSRNMVGKRSGPKYILPKYEGHTAQFDHHTLKIC